MYYDPIFEGEAARERHEQMIKDAEHIRLINSVEAQPQTTTTPAQRLTRLVTALVSIK